MTDKSIRPYHLPDLTRLNNAIKKLNTVPPSKINKYVLQGEINVDAYDEDTRVKYLAMHFVANEQGQTAPAYRDMLNVKNHKNLSKIEEIIGRDRQLIDVHYLFCQHRSRIHASESIFNALFDEEVELFDWLLACDFVSMRTSAKTKADKMLAIPNDVQLELNTLRSETIRTKRHYLNDRRQLLTKRLFEQQGKSSSRMSQAKARVMAEGILPLLFAAGSPTKAVEYKRLMNGRELNKEERLAEVKQMSEHKRWFNAGSIGKINWKESSGYE